MPGVSLHMRMSRDPERRRQYHTQCRYVRSLGEVMYASSVGDAMILSARHQHICSNMLPSHDLISTVERRNRFHTYGDDLLSRDASREDDQAKLPTRPSTHLPPIAEPFRYPESHRTYR